MIEKIISGAQTGVDQAALFVAAGLSIPTGGVAPHGWLTETGPEKEMMIGFGMTECSRPGWVARTEANIRAAHATLIIYPWRRGALSGGSYTTDCIVRSLDKPLLMVRELDERDIAAFRFWIERSTSQQFPWILNVAGPRESKCQGVYSEAVGWLAEALEPFSR